MQVSVPQIIAHHQQQIRPRRLPARHGPRQAAGRQRRGHDRCDGRDHLAAKLAQARRQSGGGHGVAPGCGGSRPPLQARGAGGDLRQLYWLAPAELGLPQPHPPSHRSRMSLHPRRCRSSCQLAPPCGWLPPYYRLSGRRSGPTPRRRPPRRPGGCCSPTTSTAASPMSGGKRWEAAGRPTASREPRPQAGRSPGWGPAHLHSRVGRSRRVGPPSDGIP